MVAPRAVLHQSSFTAVLHGWGTVRANCAECSLEPVTWSTFLARPFQEGEPPGTSPGEVAVAVLSVAVPDGAEGW